MTPEENADLYRSITGVARAHSPETCSGAWCIVHNPMYPLVGRRLVYRHDTGMTEELCEHGIGHPVPEDGLGIVHSCDGCCYKEGR